MDNNKEQVEMLTILSEDNLEDIVGGSANYKLHCWFKNSYATQQVHWKYGANRIKCYHTVCNSGCACHGKNGSDHCVEKWHWATDEGGTSQLKPTSFKNHTAKNSSGPSGYFVDSNAPKGW